MLARAARVRRRGEARVHELGRDFADRMYAALDEDFNTAMALGHAFELARAINRFANHKKAKARGGPVVASALVGLKRFAAALGVLTGTPEAFQDEVKAKRLPAMGLTRAEVEGLIADRHGEGRADHRQGGKDQ